MMTTTMGSRNLMAAPWSTRRRLGAVGMALALAASAAPGIAQQRGSDKKAADNKAGAKAAPAAPGGGQTFLIDTFGDWKALTSGKDKQKVCYALSQPKERLPKTLNRDPGFLFISNRIADGTKHEVAFKLGFAAKPGQDGALTVGSGSFPLVASGDSAFLKNPAQENQLIEQMKKASGIAIKMASARGNETTDKYSTNGFAKALEAVFKECP